MSQKQQIWEMSTAGASEKERCLKWSTIGLTRQETDGEVWGYLLWRYP